jgi:hypothetical protein
LGLDEVLQTHAPTLARPARSHRAGLSNSQKNADRLHDLCTLAGAACDCKSSA